MAGYEKGALTILQQEQQQNKKNNFSILRGGWIF